MPNPVKVFANNNLGLEYKYAAFTDELLDSKGTGQASVLPEINLATGNLIIKSSVKVQERIGDFELGYVYNAQNPKPWSITVPSINLLGTSASQLTFCEKDGSSVIYVFDKSKNAYVAPSGGESKPFITIQTSSNEDGSVQPASFAKTDPKTGVKTFFGANGLITSVCDARGFSMQYDYDANGNLQTITSDAGVYAVNTQNNPVTITFTATGSKNVDELGVWTFDSSGRLESFEIPSANNYTTNYTYNGTTNQLITITQTDNTSLAFTYTADSSTLETVTQGGNGAYTFSYNQNNSTDTTITDPLGFITTATLTENNTIATFVRSVGDTSETVTELTTTCSYNNNDLTKIQKPDGSIKSFVIDSHGLITQEVDNCKNTQWTYDPDTFAPKIKKEWQGGSGSSPVYTTTYYVYDTTFNKNLRFEVSPEGRVTEHRYNKKGILKSTRVYLLNLYNTSSLTPTTPIHYDDIEIWAKKQNKSLVSLTTFSENLRGQKTEVRQFSEVDVNGNGIHTLGASCDEYRNHTLSGKTQTHAEKVNVLDGRDVIAITQTEFDGLDRETVKTDALQNTKTISYNDSNQNAVVTECNGRTETRNWNSAGQITSVVTAVPGVSTTRTVTNSYDATGRLSSIVDIGGQTTYYLYDSLDRIRFTITPMGRVTEYFYDDVNGYKGITRYYNEVTTTTFSTTPPTFTWLSQNISPDSSQDVTTYECKCYLNGDLIKYEIDGRGAVVQHQYNSQNLEILTVEYAAQITDAEIAALKTGQFIRTPNSSINRVTAKFYDNDNNLIAEQNPAGYFTTYTRNAAGFVVEKYKYATAIPVVLNNTLPTLQKSDGDYSKFYYLDAKGQARLKVNNYISPDETNTTTNYAVAQEFYPNGKLATKTKYANATTQPTLGSKPANLIPDANPEDQLTSNEYDLNGRLIAQHLPKMCLETRQFDQMGNVVLETVGDDPTQLPSNATINTRGTARQYDDWGQLIGEAPPLVYAKILSILNNQNLTPAEQQTQIESVWSYEALQYNYDPVTGLLISMFDIVPARTKAWDEQYPSLSEIFYCYDLDRRNVLEINGTGYTLANDPGLNIEAKNWHPIFNNKITQKHRYWYGFGFDNTNNIPLTGGFITTELSSYLLMIQTSADIFENYTCDGGGDVNYYEDPDGYVTTTQFNMFGELETQNRCVNSTTPSLTMTRTYNTLGLKLTETQTANNVSIVTETNTYNNFRGLRDSFTDANGARENYFFTPRGDLYSFFNRLGEVTIFVYDAFKRQVSRTLPTLQTIQEKYTQASRQIQTIYNDANNQFLKNTAKIFDAFENAIISQDAMGHIRTVVFNSDNQITSETDEIGNINENTYDLGGLPLTSVYQQFDSLYSTTTQFFYRWGKNLISKTKDATNLSIKESYRWDTFSQVYGLIDRSTGFRISYNFNNRSLATTAYFGDPETDQTYNGEKKVSLLTRSTSGHSETYTKQTIFDGFGREYQKIIDPNGLALTYTTNRDNVGRVIATTNPNGFTSYLIRDAKGNIIFEINAKGGVTQHQYNPSKDKDKEDELAITIEYVTAIPLSQLSVGMTVNQVSALISTTPYDQQTNYFYDDFSNERFRINKQGAVVETRYDLNNRKIGHIQYYSPLNLNISGFTTKDIEVQCSAIRDYSKDKATFRILDAIGQEVFIINADGSVIQKMYHSTPNTVNHEIRYANKIANPESFSQLTASEITALLVPSDQDRHTYWVIDGIGRLQSHVKPNGAVTQYQYLGDTENPTQIVNYASPITINNSTVYSQLLTQLNGLTPTSGADNIETLAYDSANRLSTRTNGLGNSESFTYNGTSQVASHTTLRGQTWTYQYDNAGRLTQESSPNTTVYSTSFDPQNVTSVSIASTSNSPVVKQIAYDFSVVTSITSGVGLSDERTVYFGYNYLYQQNQILWYNIPVDEPLSNTSYTVRPEEMDTLIASRVHDAHGKKLVDVDVSGNTTFFIYDSTGQLQYKVDALGYVKQFIRNGFGECEHLIQYATALTINLSQYNFTGITPDIIQANLQPDPNNDRSFNQVFDQNGNVIQLTRDPVVCYIPNSSNVTSPTVATQTPTTTTTYNTFGEKVSQSTVIDQTNNVVSQCLTWRDQSGNEIATVDANGKAVVNIFNMQNKKTSEYTFATFIPQNQMPTASTTYTELESILSGMANAANDHHIETTYDAIGNILSVTNRNVLTQQIVEGKQQFENNPNGLVDLTVTYTYTKDNKVKTKTDASGNVESYFYDERGFLIAKASPKRTQTLPDNTTETIQPIIYYSYDAHGNCVQTYEPAGGCNVIKDFTSDTVPTEISTTQDRKTYTCYDPRNNVLVEQDARGNLKQFTYTADSKVARDYYVTTNPTNNNGGTVNQIDEHRKTYDALNNVLTEATYRDSATNGQPSGIVYRQYNGFGEIVAEGPDGQSWPLQNQYDQLGFLWSTRNEKGGAQLKGHDATGNETVRIESQTQDLSTTDYSQLSTVMQSMSDTTNGGAISGTIFQNKFYQTFHDLMGRVIELGEPGYFDENNNPQWPIYAIEFDPFGNKISITKPSGATTTYTYNKSNQVTTQTDPAITVTTPTGTLPNVSAVKTYGYNAGGGKIGILDTNGNTQLFVLDEVNQTVSHILGDGTACRNNTLDVFGQAFQVTDSSGNTIQRVFNRKGKVEQETDGDGNTTVYTLNENNFVIQKTPPQGSSTGVTCYAQGVFGDMAIEYLPMGQTHTYEHDRHHNILAHVARNSDGSIVYGTATNYNWFGYKVFHTDGTGSTFKYIYYPDGEIQQELGVTLQGHGDTLTFDPVNTVFSQTPTAMPTKNITYLYDGVTQTGISDNSNPNNQQYLYRTRDVDGNITSTTESIGNNFLRSPVWQYNGRGWVVSQTDIRDISPTNAATFSSSTGHDNLGNIVNNSGNYNSAGNVSSASGWNVVDQANRPIKINCVNNSGDIQPTSTQGNALTYQGNLPVRETNFVDSTQGSLANGNPLAVVFTRDPNGRVITISTAPYGSAPQPYQPFSSGQVCPYNILPIPNGIGFSRASSPFPPSCTLNWSNSELPIVPVNDIFGALAVGNQVIIGTPYSYTGPIVSGDDVNFSASSVPTSSNYIALVVVNVNGQIYQGSTQAPGQAPNIYYYAMSVCYTPDGFLQSVFNTFQTSSYFAQNATFIFLQNTHNANGRLTNSIAFTSDNNNVNSTFSNHGVDGIAANSTTQYGNAPQPVIDTLNTAFRYFDTTVIKSVGGQRQDQYGTNNVTSNRYYDQNNRLVAATNVYNPFDPNDNNSYDVYIENSLDGRVLSTYRVLFSTSFPFSNLSRKDEKTLRKFIQNDRAGINSELSEIFDKIQSAKIKSRDLKKIKLNSKQVKLLKDFLDKKNRKLSDKLLFNSGNGIASVTPTRFFYDPHGHILARYGQVANSQNTTELVLQYADPVTADDIASLTQRQRHTVIQPNDSWDAISSRLFGSSKYKFILEAYGDIPFSPGQHIDGMRALNAYRNVLRYEPYQQFIQPFFNSLSPALKTPQPPRQSQGGSSFWGIVGEVAAIVVGVVVTCFAPEIGALLFGPIAAGLTGALEMGAEYAIAGAVSDAASQGILDEAGDQHGFSFKEMIGHAMTTGITAGLAEELGISELVGKKEYMQAFSEVAGTALTAQLIAWGARLRGKPSLKEILTQAAQKVLLTKTNQEIDEDAKSDPKASKFFADAGERIGTESIDATLSANALACGINVAVKGIGVSVMDDADIIGVRENSRQSNVISPGSDILQPATFESLTNKTRRIVPQQSAANDSRFNQNNAYGLFATADKQYRDSVRAMNEATNLSSPASFDNPQTMFGHRNKQNGYQMRDDQHHSYGN